MGTNPDPPEQVDTAMGSQTGELLGALARAPEIPLEWMGPPRLRAGDMVAECFVVERVLGEGGMGVVYLARDRDLDRLVGLKVHRRGRSEHALPRMLAEAKAMAKIVHANVVSVHMVGTHRDALFIAMEYCPRGTLRRWLRDETRSTAEVLDMFTAIGAGLAAAHRAGLVHRDFKPDNVLLGEDGQPRVADFGLAVGQDASDENLNTKSAKEPSEDATATSGERSIVDATAGTPAYMAPEQYGAGTLDARTDQFAFCVALYEGLSGQRPFDPPSSDDAESAAADPRAERRLAAIVAGPSRTVRGVPSAVMRVVLRGLAADPNARFPSMDALLTALGRARRRRVQQLAAVGGILTLSAGLWAATAAPEPPSAPECDPSTRLDGIWGEPQRRQINELAERGPEYERDAWHGLARSLDGYGQRWRLTWRQSCVDRGGEDSQHPVDRCLAHARGRLLAFVQTLPSGATLEGTLGAFAELPDPLDCAQAQPSQRPPDADALHEQLQQLLIQLRATPTPQLREQLAALAQQAEDAGWKDILSAAQRHEGRLSYDESGIEEAEPHYRSAILHGLASGDSALSIRAWNDLAVLLAGTAGRADDAEELADLAWAAVASHDDPRLRFHVAMGRISVLRDEGRQDEAITVGRKALEEQIEQLGSNHLLVGDARLNLAAALIDRRQMSEALEHLRPALEIEREAVGPNHPSVAVILANIGVACMSQGDFDCARSHIEQALAIEVAAYGNDDPRTIGSHTKRAILLQQTGESEQALREFEQISRLEQARRDASPAAIARAMANIAAQNGNLERWDQARIHAEQALEQFQIAHGPRHPALIPISTMLGSIERSAGSIDQSLKRLHEAERLCDEVLPPDHLARVNTIIELGKTQFAAGDAAGSTASGRRALSLLVGHDVPPAQLAEARFVVARALGPQSDEGRGLATEALTSYEALGAGYAKEAAEIRAWQQP
ncbi:MAG: serine/threonine-protein kinase [Myxococcota bacterium]